VTCSSTGLHVERKHYDRQHCSAAAADDDDDDGDDDDGDDDGDTVSHMFYFV